MISHFPHPYPDELFYSIIARYHSRMGNTCHRITLLELFGSRNVMVSADLPGQIATLVNRLPRTMRYSAKHIVYNHTLYPFYAPFLPKDRADKVLHQMYSNGGRSIHYTAGLMASRFSLEHNIRYCPKCIVDDRRRFGEAYWHRSHQLPLLPVCWHHGSILADSNTSAFGSKTDGFVHLDEFRDLTESVSYDFETNVLKWLIRIATDGAWLLNHPQQPKHLQYYRERYLEILNQHGLVSRSGKMVDQEALQDRLFKMYPRQLLQFLGLNFDNENDHNWLRGMVRKYRKAVHPLLHFLLIHLFWGSFEKFACQSSAIHEKHFIPINAPAKANEISDLRLEEKRQQWMALETLFPEDGRGGLRKRAPALYAWIYRNDIEWLRGRPIKACNQTAMNQRVNWSLRDNETLERAEVWLTQEQCREGKPKRITALRIAKDLDVRAWVEKHPEKLPLTMQFLKRVEESIAQYQIRRIILAVKSMRDSGIPLIEWRIRRAAGLRDKLHPEVEKVLDNNLNDMTVGGNFEHAIQDMAFWS